MRNSVVEKDLDKTPVKYEYIESLSLGKFDEEASLRNQARFDPIHEEAVLRYTEAMERGDEFPALVAYKTASGKYVLIDGNHRYQAAKRAKLKDFDVYVVDANPDIIQLLTFKSNSIHGLPPSVEERTRHAIYLIDNGATTDTAAAATGLLASTVQGAWQLERANRRARSLSLTRGWNRLTRQQKTRLAAISTDAGFKAATEFTIEARLTWMETQKMTNEMRGLKSDRAQVQAVEELRDHYRQMNAAATTGPSRVQQRLDARRSFIPHVAYVAGCDMDAVVNACITPAQAEDMLTRTKEAINSLTLLRSVLQDRENPPVVSSNET